MAPEGRMGQMEMKCIFDIGKKFKWAKVSQVSDVAHGPLVWILLPIYYLCFTNIPCTVIEWESNLF
jgi:hypothetical protein